MSGTFCAGRVYENFIFRINHMARVRPSKWKEEVVGEFLWHRLGFVCDTAGCFWINNPKIFFKKLLVSYLKFITSKPCGVFKVSSTKINNCQSTKISRFWGFIFSQSPCTWNTLNCRSFSRIKTPNKAQMMQNLNMQFSAERYNELPGAVLCRFVHTTIACE